MRIAIAGFLFLVACQSDQATTNFVRTETVNDAPELPQDKATSLVRATNRNVRSFQELRLQGKTQQMLAVHNAIGDTVDREFDTFRRVALEADTVIVRNMATKCLAFAIEKRRESRDTLLVLLRDTDMTIVANAVLGIGILRDKETDLTPIVTLLGHGLVNVRTNAATAIASLFLVMETPRVLTPQYHAAIGRLVTMLHDDASTRSRRAAAWALANLRHPQTLEHLVSALDDDDEQVQFGGMRGLEVLGDQRALEPVLDYLGSSPTPEGASYAQLALEAIVVQAGFADTKAELKDLGTSPRSWRDWIKDQRMK